MATTSTSKSGTIGEIAYNVIWGSGGNGIKLNADVTLPRLTNMCIHNNTIVAGGWRRVGELGYAILVDKSARAQIYNNIMGDMYQELEITTKADTVRTVYDNNLFFYSVDSLGGAARYFPSDGVTRQAAHDIVDVQASALFASYSPYFTTDWFGLDGSNDYHPLASSPAIGHGFTPPGTWTNPYFTGTLPGDPNMGALGVYVTTKVNTQGSALPKNFALNQNYPNPFNPSTVISYQLASDTRATLKVYDILGREVATLVDGYQTAGVHQVQFNAQNLSSGVYFYRLSAPGQDFVKKMLLMK